MKRAEKEGGLESGVPDEFDAFWDRYTSWVRFKDLGLDADRCRELVERQGERTFRGVFRAVLMAYGERVGAARVGEKSPGHVLFLPQLLKWFPKARIIIMRRDPRAVVASQLHTPWVQNRLTPFSLRGGFLLGKRCHEVAYYADDWTTIYEDITTTWQDDPRVHIVAYEDLVQDAEGELRAVCDFVGESYEPAMLTERTRETVPLPAGTAKSDLERWRRKHHDKTLRPISADSLEKWKERLSQTEVAMVEGYCTGMRAAGYAPSMPALHRSIGRVVTEAVLKTGSAEEGMRRIAGKVIGKVLHLYHSARRTTRRYRRGELF